MTSVYSPRCPHMFNLPSITFIKAVEPGSAMGLSKELAQLRQHERNLSNNFSFSQSEFYTRARSCKAWKYHCFTHTFNKINCIQNNQGNNTKKHCSIWSKGGDYIIYKLRYSWRPLKYWYRCKNLNELIYRIYKSYNDHNEVKNRLLQFWST